MKWWMEKEIGMYLLIFVPAFCLGILTGWLYFRKRENELMIRLKEMIDAAKDGKLQDIHYDETKYSAVENNLKHYMDGGQIAEEQLSKQKEAIQQMISDIAHQVVTPLSNIQIYGELLKEQKSGEEIDIICDQAEKLDFLIQSLVKLSRLETGIITVNGCENKICSLFQAMDSRFRKKAEEKQISYIIEETTLSAVFDRKWTEEALANLVDNAIKYTPEKGKVCLRAEAYSFFTRIDVVDTGIGMEEGEINKIFQRFYRALEVSEQPGVGIGLYLSREIAKAQKGYIKVKSEKGKGSVFSLFLPNENVSKV